MDKVLQLKSLTLDYFSNVFVRFYLATQTLFRIALCIFAISRSQISLDEIPVILINGFVVDFISTFFVLPLVVVLQNFNAKILSKILPISNILSFIACIVFAGILVFSGVAQICFWDEFSTNFNFIAVDYLIYTHEIIGTLKDSMPLYEILSIVIMSSCFVGIWIYQASSRYKVPSIKLAVAAFFVAITAGSKYNFEQHFLYNKFATEIAKNGPYEFISAFYNSSLDYTKFYPLVGDDEALNFVRRKLSATNSTFVDDNSVDRNVIGNKALKKRNVILITVESLSAEYLTYFGNKNNITPYLDELASSGMLFTNIYATGTRTVRGLEALTLGIPPLPGESIIKRPNNHGFTTIAVPFLENGYQVDFFYGGYSYFDNMKNYFTGNGFNVIDRSDIDKQDVSFSNVWGVADEDLFKKFIEVADRHNKLDRNFFSLIMTTSNHRPYNFPEGRIDLPQGTRNAAVKYTDYAIGKFIEVAKTKPWFDDTIFVIIADHCASSAGKVDLPLEKYKIPLIIYAPSFIKPSTNDNLASQIDVPPTILAMTSLNYRSKFFGQDIISSPPNRAFISTYQLLGYVSDSNLIILSPNVSPVGYDVGGVERKLIDPPKDLVEESISYHQLASKLIEFKKMQE